jgi:hypothetical protein
MIAPVQFVDNSSCVEMIARSKDSIINTLDSVCRAPGPTEEKLNSLLHQVCACRGIDLMTSSPPPSLPPPCHDRFTPTNQTFLSLSLATNDTASSSSTTPSL